ncbi:DNA cytosine methyltransferase [Streptomyces sp. NPDC059037]|uniref:DNA cytosine methyltransferase n=1 Tax=Streptomyces sp. NPDC059037 TaxID=3346710 RepID=UPI0036CCF3E8
MAGADPSIGSLCSGVGGLDLGVQAVLGGHIIWHADSDSRAAKVLARHWPRTPNLGDVRAVDWHQVEPVSVLTAGFPCQDLSVAGPRTGLVPGTPSGLWHHIVTAIEVLNPCLVVIENVRGLLSTRAGTHPLRHVESCPRCVGDRAGESRMRALGVLLADLTDLGYDANWTCVRASDIGAPHRRERVFLVAWPTTPPCRAAAEDPDIEPGQQRRLPAPRQAQGPRPRPHPCRRGRARCQGLAQPAVRQRHPHLGLHRSHPRRLDRQEGAAAAHADLLRRERRCRRDPETQRWHESSDSRHSPASWWGDYLPAIRRWEHVTQRAACQPTQPGTRRLSAEFVEWMMGFPEGWVTATEGLSRAAHLRLLGNSVVHHQATHAMRLLLQEILPRRVRPLALQTQNVGEQ